MSSSPLQPPGPRGIRRASSSTLFPETFLFLFSLSRKEQARPGQAGDTLTQNTPHSGVPLLQSEIRPSDVFLNGVL